MKYRAVWTYYGPDGLTKHFPAHDKWLHDRNEAAIYIMPPNKHPIREGYTASGNDIKEKQ